jgi:hypothetical protein
MKRTIVFLLLFSINSVFGQIDFVPKTVFKFDPLQLLTSGELNMSLEQKIARQLSLEADFGLLKFEVIDNPFTSLNDEDFNTISKMGGFGSIGIRFYPLQSNEAPAGLYIEPQFKYRAYNFYYNTITYNGEVPTGSRKQTIGSFNLGYQFWAADRFAFDFYGSVGIKMTEYKGIRNEEDALGNTFMAPYTEKKSDVALVFGIKFCAGISKY